MMSLNLKAALLSLLLLACALGAWQLAAAPPPPPAARPRRHAAPLTMSMPS